jgi:long-chain acyl-CoA synthetase
MSHSIVRLYLPFQRTVQALPNAAGSVKKDALRSWAQVHDDVLATAGALGDLGVGKGAMVAVLAFNSPRWLDIYFACWRIGAAIVPLNVRLAPFELAEQLRDCGARVLLADRAFGELGGQLAAELGITHLSWSDGDLPAGAQRLTDLMQAAPQAEDVGAGGADLAGVFYTGGSTGRPKGVMLSHQNLFLSVVGALVFGPSGQGGAFLHTAPLFHISGATNLLSATARGIPNLFLDKFEAGEALRLITEYRPTSCVLAPTMIQMLLDHPDFEKSDLSSLQTLIYGSAPMPEPLLRRAIGKIPTTSFAQGYGMTEAAGGVSVLMPDDHELSGPHPERLKSAGKPTFVAEIRIVDEHGLDAPKGEVGEIWVRSPTIMLGYLNQPEETAKVLANGWYRTGDGVKDMIVTGAENVYSVEVETALLSHPAVAQAAVYGVPDERWGERVHAEVVLRPGADVGADELVAHCRTRIAGYKTPRSIEIRGEAFPTTPAGKVQKHLLRARHWEGRSRTVN